MTLSADLTVGLWKSTLAKRSSVTRKSQFYSSHGADNTLRQEQCFMLICDSFPLMSLDLSRYYPHSLDEEGASRMVHWEGWSLGQEDPLEKEMATHSIFLSGESHGQRSLVGVGPDLATQTTAMDETQRSWLAPRASVGSWV